MRIEKAIGHTFKWGGDPAKVEAKILAVRNEITTNPKGLGGKQLDKLRVRLAKLEQQVEVVRERARKSSIAYILELVNAGEADRIVLTDEWGACA